VVVEEARGRPRRGRAGTALGRGRPRSRGTNAARRAASARPIRWARRRTRSRGSAAPARARGWSSPARPARRPAPGHGYQIIQGLVAFANGGILGVGLGYGHPEILPAAHTDFPYAVIGEELGLLGATGVLDLFVVLALRGYAVAARAPGGFHRLLAAGLTTVLAFQSVIIMAGDLKLLPLTGITLPFVSYGGSSLLTNYLILGLLHRLSAESPPASPA